jgi:RNA polymerase sigma-70 factor (ECF subfamily)
MVDPDAQLIPGCQRGDRAALELLYRRYVDRVWRYGWLVTRSREDAAEIVQETFLRVQSSIAKFGGRSTVGTWLFAITRSAAMEFLRRKRLEERSRTAPAIFRLVRSEESAADESNALAHESTDEESRDAVRRAVAELPGAQRDAVILCEMIGMSIAEAGAVLGWGDSRVKVTLFRARRRLREKLRGVVSGSSSAKRAMGRDEGKAT